MKKFLYSLFILLTLSTIISAQNFYIGSSNPTCTACHSGVLTSWAATKHATAQADGAASAFYGYSCLKCHNVGFDESVVNGGADEYVAKGDGNTYTITDEANFNRVANVQCEACHGPKGNSTGTSVDFLHASDNTKSDYSAELCGKCHTDDHHPTFDNWKESKHAVSKFTSIPGGSFNFIASDPNCAACHTAEGFIQFIESSDLEPHVVAPGAEGSDITCTACHDPHENVNKAQLRLPVDQICAKCHNPEYNPDSPTPDGSALHHTTAYMFEGKGGYEYPGYDYSSSLHTVVVTEKCATCHVHSTPYVGGDPAIPAFTGHTFEAHGESCVPCHADFDNTSESFDYRGIQTSIKGLIETLSAKLASASSEDSTTEAFLRAKFNHDYVEADGSYGIHNTKYAKALLESAIANFTPTSVEKTSGQLPNEYQIKQNYPNPFNPSTTIEFSIPEATNVKVTVYDAIGNEIVSLVNGNFSAGVYKATWNASNQASGMYIYKIVTNNFVETRKMLLIK